MANRYHFVSRLAQITVMLHIIRLGVVLSLIEQCLAGNDPTSFGQIGADVGRDATLVVEGVPVGCDRTYLVNVDLLLVQPFNEAFRLVLPRNSLRFKFDPSIDRSFLYRLFFFLFQFCE